MGNEQEVLLFEQQVAKRVEVGNIVIATPYLDSCCLIIAWYENGAIYAQHCQDAYYINACNLPTDNRIIQAVYITAKKDGEQESHIRELNIQLNPEMAVYYSHRTKSKDVIPNVILQDERNYVLNKKEDYEMIEL